MRKLSRKEVLKMFKCSKKNLCDEAKKNPKACEGCSCDGEWRK